MKLQAKLNTLALSLLLTGALGTVSAQTAAPQQDAPVASSPAASSTAPGAERLEPDDVNTTPATTASPQATSPATASAQAASSPSPSSSTPTTDLTPEMQAGRREQESEDIAAVLPYYNNYLTTYRLGPEDVISVTVFGQDRYSRGGITIPPNGRINYPLIPEGIIVAGKTTEQVAAELTRRLNEYIIDPQITVMLEKAQSARFSVLGDVAQPGIRIMTHRLSVYEALAEAGGVLDTGDKSKVMVLRRQPDGTLASIRVNIKKYERGDARELTYLVPGDQVIVPGNSFKKFKEVMNLLPIISFARIFTGGW
ncbi:MAG TPA: polysaccharide biosynthesis/export family protein [Pyrinomonadaceae bacterium]|jgi:polysaccharide export outer membrane protein